MFARRFWTMFLPCALLLHAQPLSAQPTNTTAIVFEGAERSVYRTLTVNHPYADVEIFARDCCQRDDIVQVYVDGCLLASVSSIDGAVGRHRGESHKISLRGGLHTIEYRRATSGVDPSGWEVAETMIAITEEPGPHSCGSCFRPDREVPEAERIEFTETCGPARKLRPKWGRFGYHDVLVTDAGERLELECDGAYQLHYTSPAGQRNRVGLCPFESGCNDGWFVHSGDHNGNGMPDCLIETFWRSRDYGANDLPNPATGEAREGFLDWAVFVFDANNRQLDKLSHQFDYVIGPPLPDAACGDPFELAKLLPPGTKVIQVEGDWQKTQNLDPVVGPETEGVFRDMMTRLRGLDIPAGPMSPNPAPLCDLDGDLDCDQTDDEILTMSYGKCRGDAQFNFAADLNVDGCVGTVDQEMWRSLGGR